MAPKSRWGKRQSKDTDGAIDPPQEEEKLETVDDEKSSNARGKGKPRSTGRGKGRGRVSEDSPAAATLRTRRSGAFTEVDQQSGEGGEEGGAPGGLKRRTSTRERAKPVAYNPTEQDLDTARRRKDLKEQGGNSGDGSMGGSQRIGGDTELRGGSDDSDDDAPIRLSTRLSESVQRIKIEPSMSGEASPGYEASESDLEAAVDVPVTMLTKKPVGKRKSRLGSRNSSGMQSLSRQERLDHPPDVQPPVELAGGASEQGMPAETREETAGAEGEGVAAQSGAEPVRNSSEAGPEATPPVPLPGEPATEAGEGVHVDLDFPGVGVKLEDVPAPQLPPAEAVEEERDQAPASPIAGQPEIFEGTNNQTNSGVDAGPEGPPSGAAQEVPSNVAAPQAPPLAVAAEPGNVALGVNSQGEGGESRLAGETESATEPPVEAEGSQQTTAAVQPAAEAACPNTEIICGGATTEVAANAEFGMEAGNSVEDPRAASEIGDKETDIKMEPHEDGTQPPGQSDTGQVEVGVPAERRELRPRKKQRILSSDGVDKIDEAGVPSVGKDGHNSAGVEGAGRSLSVDSDQAKTRGRGAKRARGVKEKQPSQQADTPPAGQSGGAPTTSSAQNGKLPAPKRQKVETKVPVVHPNTAVAPIKSPIKSPPAPGAPKAASVTEDPVDSFLQDVALRKARLADNMQRYLELQQKSGLLLNQMIADIKDLDGMNITEDILSKTEIGKTMRSISKPLKQVAALPDMKGKAGALLSKWKGAVPGTKAGVGKPGQQAGRTPPPPPAVPAPASTSAPAGPASDAPPPNPPQPGMEQKVALLVTAQQPPHQASQKTQPPANGNAPTEPVPPAPLAAKEDPTRGKVRLILERALSPPGHVIPPATAARMLEEALHKYFPEKNLASGGLYLRQLYVVMSVLESEEGGCLKVMIAQGKLHPQDVAISTEEEMFEMSRSHQLS